MTYQNVYVVLCAELYAVYLLLNQTWVCLPSAQGSQSFATGLW